MIRLVKLLSELSYEGNWGMMELVDFFDKATPADVRAFTSAMDTKQYKKAWQLVQRVTGTKLKGKEFGSDK